MEEAIFNYNTYLCDCPKIGENKVYMLGDDKEYD